jgi:hypothetical protein
MGLDATVMCKCYIEGRTTEPPVARDWLYFDNEGYLSLRPEHEDDETGMKIWTWEQDCCEHSGMDYASERIANWAGYRLFQQALETVGWQHFPVLHAGLQNINGGLMAPDACAQALQELEFFRTLDTVSKNAFLINTSNGDTIHEHVACYEGVFILSGTSGLDIGIGQMEFFIRDREGDVLFRAMRIRQTLLEPGKRDRKDGPGRVEFMDLDTSEKFVCETAVRGNAIPWPGGRMQDDEGRWRSEYPSEFHVEIRNVNPSDFDYILEPLIKVFQASVEIGNPVRWC